MTKERKNLLVFGYGLPVILTFIAWRLWVKHGFGIGEVALVAAAVILGLMTAINVEWVKPVYKRWMAVGRFIGEIVSGVILGVVFICVFSIVGIILRVLGKDLLKERLDSQAGSYWIPRPECPEDPERYTRQS